MAAVWEGINYVNRFRRGTQLIIGTVMAGLGTMLYRYEMPTEVVSYDDVQVAALRPKYGIHKGINRLIMRVDSPDMAPKEIQYCRLLDEFVRFEPVDTYIAATWTGEVDPEAHRLVKMVKEHSKKREVAVMPSEYLRRTPSELLFKEYTFKMLVKARPEVGFEREWHWGFPNTTKSCMKRYLSRKLEQWRYEVDIHGKQVDFLTFLGSKEEIQEQMLAEVERQFDQHVLIEDAKLIIEEGDTVVRQQIAGGGVMM